MTGAEGSAHRQVDATLLMQLTEQLQAMHDRVSHAAVSDEQRGRWQTRLAAISQGAAADLDRAAGQLRRMAADLDRHGA